MGKSKAAVADQPTRRTVEQLFKDLSGRYYGYGHEDYEKTKDLETQIEDLKVKLLDVPEMRELQKRRSELEGQLAARRKAINERLGKVRRQYFAHGLTPAVLKQVQDLVEFVNDEPARP